MLVTRTLYINKSVLETVQFDLTIICIDLKLNIKQFTPTKMGKLFVPNTFTYFLGEFVVILL